MSRLTQILRGKKIKPLTEMESAVKYAIDNAGSGGGSGLPDVTSADNGSLLGVSGGEWAKVASPVPDVTSDDNGDLLGVVEGAWAKVASTAPMVVTGTGDTTSVTITTALADIKAAFNAGRPVYLQIFDTRLTLVACAEDNASIFVSFTAVSYDEDDSKFSAMAVYFDGTTTGVIALRELTVS